MNIPPRVLIVDDEPDMLSGCSKILRALNYQPVPVQEGRLALQLLKDEIFDLVLCDLFMPDLDGMEILEAALKYAPHTPFIIFTAYGTIDRAVAAMKQGAFDFLEKPFDADHLKVVLEKGIKQRNLYHERENLLRQLEDKYSFDNIIGKSPQMNAIFEMVESVSTSDANVLVTGESGTGKELIARSIHARSERKTKSFVPVNCGAFPESLFEAELFGYEKGAFTGANKRKIGLLEYANGGTFFLDEVCELPLNLQTKLLRVLQSRNLRHIGGNELIDIDVRLISATNRDMHTALEKGLIRDDFYYRLNVINIHLPPLRERREDINLLAEYFLQKAVKGSAKEIEGFDEAVLTRFENYNWPGNVRELENVIERAVALARDDRITIHELPPEFDDLAEQALPFERLSLAQVKQELVEDVEQKYLLYLLHKHGGNVTKIAAEAGMTRRNIHRLLNRHNIDPKTWRG